MRPARAALALLVSRAAAASAHVPPVPTRALATVPLPMAGLAAGAPAADDGLLVGFITAPDAAVADALAEAIVTQRLAACVNILPGVSSVYMWEGKLERSTEQLLMVKTRASAAGALRELLRARHPYDVPELIFTPLREDLGNADYLQWVRDNTRGSAGAPGGAS